MELKLANNMHAVHRYLVIDVWATFFRHPASLFYLYLCILFFQYGFINYALELQVVKTFGEEIWEKIK